MQEFRLSQKFEILEELGTGSFSKVYKVRRLTTRKIYALKRITLSKLKPKEIQNSLNEIRILASISHPQIISYKESFIDSNSKDLCIIMDYCGGGDLSKLIKTQKSNKIRISEHKIIKFFYQMVSAIFELHIRKIIHWDLKTANIFISSDLQSLRLGDMNVSKITKNTFAFT